MADDDVRRGGVDRATKRATGAPRHHRGAQSGRREHVHRRARAAQFVVETPFITERNVVLESGACRCRRQRDEQTLDASKEVSAVNVKQTQGNRRQAARRASTSRCMPTFTLVTALTARTAANPVIRTALAADRVSAMCPLTESKSEGAGPM